MWRVSTHALWSGVQVEPLHFSHVPAAVHLPSVPHELLAVAAHRPFGSIAPVGTARQTPSIWPDAPARLQAIQTPQLGLPQQTPSTQFPLEHSKSAAHMAPLGCFWQVLPMHRLPPEGSLLDGASALQSEVVLEQVALHWPLLALHW